MVKIAHPSMQKGRDPARSVPQGKTFVVEDASRGETMTEQNELERKLAEFEGTDEEQEVEMPQVFEANGPVATNQESPKPVEKNKINEEIQRSLEDLIFIGRHSKVVDLAGHKFEISTLTHREHNHVVSELMNIGQAADLFAIRIFTLAYAIRRIDDKTLAKIEIPGEYDDPYLRQITVVDHLQLSLVERLYKAYEELVKESNSAVYGENVKN